MVLMATGGTDSNEAKNTSNLSYDPAQFNGFRKDKPCPKCFGTLYDNDGCRRCQSNKVADEARELEASKAKEALQKAIASKKGSGK